MVRNDVTVDWGASPRVVTVAAPSREVTIRDLQDTLRVLEMSDEGMLHPPLRGCTGNDELGGGTRVSLTLKLLNARVAFEARPGPAWELCTISGGNLVAVDAAGQPMEVRHPTAYVTVDRAASSSGTVTVVETGGSALTSEEHDQLMALQNPDLDPVAKSVELEPLARTADLANLDAPVSTRATPADLAVTVEPTPVVVNPSLTQVEHDHLMALSNADLSALAAAVADLHDEAFGRWSLDFNANTMTLYRKDGSLLKTFTLTRSSTAEPPVYVGRSP